jgi:hypothetical protein
MIGEAIEHRPTMTSREESGNMPPSTLVPSGGADIPIFSLSSPPPEDVLPELVTVEGFDEHL